MIDMNNDYPIRENKFQIYEKEQIRKKIIEDIKELSEEDLYFLMEILQYTVRA